jgi:hypothetical protein
MWRYVFLQLRYVTCALKVKRNMARVMNSAHEDNGVAVGTAARGVKFEPWPRDDSTPYFLDYSSYFEQN